MATFSVYLPPAYLPPALARLACCALALSIGCLGARSAPDTGWWEHECPDDPEGRCVLDPCVDGSLSGEAGIACCIDAHGRGLDAVSGEELSAACEGAECDPTQYLSRAAAICAAQVQGLGVGVAGCGAGFWFSEGRGSWLAVNVTETFRGCSRSGECLSVDATTGFNPDPGVVCEWAD